jgi:hypothetical protein
MTDHIEPDDSMLNKQPADPIENADRKDPTDPTDRAEPTLPIERTDPFEAMERIEFSEANDHREEPGAFIEATITVVRSSSTTAGYEHPLVVPQLPHT